MNVLVFDPSGNFTEGSGTTGWAWFTQKELTDFGTLKARDFDRAESYWDAHLQMIRQLSPEIVVYETYALRAGKALEQSWSHLETPQLIGVIRHACWQKNIPCVGQQPSLRTRFNDNVLKAINLMDAKNRIMGKATNQHMRDAIAHGLYFIRYGERGLEKWTGKNTIGNGV